MYHEEIAEIVSSYWDDVCAGVIVGQHDADTSTVMDQLLRERPSRWCRCGRTRVRSWDDADVECPHCRAPVRGAEWRGLARDARDLARRLACAYSLSLDAARRYLGELAARPECAREPTPEEVQGGAMTLLEFCRQKAGNWTWTPEYADLLGAAVQLAEEVAGVIGADPAELFHSYAWAQELLAAWAVYMADGVLPPSVSRWQLLRELSEAARELSHDISDVLPTGYYAWEEDRQYGVWAAEE